MLHRLQLAVIKALSLAAFLCEKAKLFFLEQKCPINPLIEPTS